MDFDFLEVWDDEGRHLGGILMGRFSPFDWTGFALGQGIGGFLPPGGFAEPKNAASARWVQGAFPARKSVQSPASKAGCGGAKRDHGTTDG